MLQQKGACLNLMKHYDLMQISLIMFIKYKHDIYILQNS